MGRKHGLSVKIQLDLFDKMVKPILLYGCEVWGFSNNDIIEKVHSLSLEKNITLLLSVFTLSFQIEQ
jgi:hypothetical protein